MAKRRKTRRLTGRDRRILHHLAEFRAADFDVLHRRFFPGKNAEAVRSTLRRLSQGPHYVLRSVPLDGRAMWYQLTPAGVRQIGVSENVCRPLGPQAAARQFALQWFLFGSDNAGVRLIQLHDFPDLFPIGGQRLPQGKFYLATQRASPNDDQSSASDVPSYPSPDVVPHPAPAELATKLGYVVIDFGGKPQRIAQRLLKTLLRFLKQGWFDDLIRQQQFEITLLTITAGRRRGYEHSLPRLLRQALSIELSRLQRPDQQELPFAIQVRVVPRLVEIVYG